jgi:class 3 adenylate cyclase
MGTEPLERKLAAILYADVAGYSRLTGENEEGTHRALSAYLDTLTTSKQVVVGFIPSPVMGEG